MSSRDTSLDTLLDLDGQTLFIHDNYWVKFGVIRTPVSPERPHGLSYSLTLHSAFGERIVGFDNAHPVADVKGPGRRSKQKYDHKHRFRTIRPYDYSDAGTLLEDFWKEVDSVLREVGVIK
ncbi:toxin-antitoxin system TumE family protein [Phyllobacterium sp. LjRoot231]|uniref:toxin-antitoxin system TumE family protein n=1 Tax=Phyllobacterium sp. LjRoot231 TaxID=3342289 RepID=UPI003F503915